MKMHKYIKKGLKWLLILLSIITVLFYLNNRAIPLERPDPLNADLREANPPKTMQIFQIPTGVNHRSAAFAYRGGSFFDKRAFSMSVILIRHPKGDLLIDAGFSKDVKKHFSSMPFYFKMITDFDPRNSAAEQLDKFGYNQDSIKAILLTHAHWDHVSGIPDFKNTPILVSENEFKFINGLNKFSALARSFTNAKYTSYSFQQKAYLGFPLSFDFYCDVSIVIVPAPGHTPGSVIIFITSPTGKRYAMIGDLAWQVEGVLDLEERPFLQSELGDDDRTLVRENLQKMYAIHEKFPAITIVPAHDARAFISILTLEKMNTSDSSTMHP
jgi:N-acyl homoserine lactone hydrolase